jgi:Rps23 Pro-64 3,4-dihydroxylase Tpa1-like proline 4-hydroxylase|tara:strand:+ start:188 stop:751 length:564 start_codon:yes stop_codon:yes gene_type:complete
MNLVYQLKNDLFWIQNFLPQQLYKDMYVQAIKKRNDSNFQPTDVNWRTYKEEVDDMSYSYNQRNPATNNKLFTKYHTLLKHQRFVNLIDKQFDSHLRKYTYGQHLTWHKDDLKTRVYAATFYFNKTWDQNWGGEFMFKTDTSSGFLPIVGNSIIIAKCGLVHKVNANLKKTHPRLSIQTWIFDKDEK